MTIFVLLPLAAFILFFAVGPLWLLSKIVGENSRWMYLGFPLILSWPFIALYALDLFGLGSGSWTG